MPHSLLDPLCSIPIAVVDVETTGASAEFGDRVIEIGIARIVGGRVTAQYEQLIDPQRRISAGVTVLTGITQAMVTGQPTFADQFPKMMELFQGALILGHNVRFDLSFLLREFRRAGHDLVKDLDNAHVLDTVRMARKRFGRGGNGLQHLCRRLGYQPDIAHRALPDVITTFEVFRKLLEPVGGWQISLCDTLVQQGGPMGLLPASPRESLLPLELEEALEQRCTVMMEYLDARQKRTERLIQPIEVRRFKGELTLVAHCLLRNDRRNFKLERIVRLSRTDIVQPELPWRMSNNT
jgi:DNA polymerase III epsilon subunit family exonuclease